MSANQKKQRRIDPSKRKLRKLRKGIGERRKQDYATNPALRKKINTRNREAYREKNNVESRMALPQSKVKSVSTSRYVPSLGQRIQTLNVKEMALALGGYHKIVLYRWIESNRFPKPPYQLTTGGAVTGVYSLAQAKKIVALMRDHQKKNSHFRTKHYTLISLLHEVVSDTE